MSRVTKSYGTNVVLREIDLEVPVDQKVAVIGRSGSGKTTLLRLIMTLERPDSGSIEILGELLGSKRVDGKLVADAERHVRRVRANVGMVFQHFNLFPHMTALQNVTDAPIHVLGMTKSAARERALELLSMVGLQDKTDAYPRNLSGGQQQRVAIARALAMQPKVMLFDEVTSALDPELVGEVLGVIRGLTEIRGMTMLIVTHEMQFAMRVADRVLFMEDGLIVEDGTPAVILGKPEHPKTQRFLRSILDRTGG
jgi:polar amino acid transport system ATP-binding protein